MERLAGNLIQKVPLFFGFRPKEMQAFIDICKLVKHESGEVLCEFNTASNRLFILIEGELGVYGPDGILLVALKPVQCIGEMGFISRKPRSATVRALAASRVMRVDYIQFEGLIERNASLRAKIYRNLVRILSDRLSDANDMVMRYRKLYESGRNARSLVPDLLEEGGDSLEPEGVASGDGGDIPPAENVQPEEAETAAGEDEGEYERLLNTFYELASLEPAAEQLGEDLAICQQLHKDGYKPVDIEYAIKWTVRNIPGIKRFNLVKLSIAEAFEDKWSI